MKINVLWVETSEICSRSVIYLILMFSGLGDETWPRALLPLAGITAFNTLIRKPASINHVENLLAYISSTSPDNLLPAVSGPLFVIKAVLFPRAATCGFSRSTEIRSSLLSHAEEAHHSLAVPIACGQLRFW
jgi:hypothetical protein